MNEFVEECRREWRRLGVPDPLADEMAADLAVDLAEAEAEGASAEDVLGTGASDPRGFAAAWAAERGVAARRPARRRIRSRPFVLAVIALLAVVAIVGAVLVISDSGSARDDSIGRTDFAIPPPSARLKVVVAPPPGRVWVTVRPDGDEADGSATTRTVGSILLVVGLAGVVLLTAYAVFSLPARRAAPA